MQLTWECARSRWLTASGVGFGLVLLTMLMVSLAGCRSAEPAKPTTPAGPVRLTVVFHSTENTDHGELVLDGDSFSLTSSSDRLPDGRPGKPLITGELPAGSAAALLECVQSDGFSSRVADQRYSVTFIQDGRTIGELQSAEHWSLVDKVTKHPRVGRVLREVMNLPKEYWFGRVRPPHTMEQRIIPGGGGKPPGTGTDGRDGGGG